MLLKILRRTHLYLALFLTPWVLMYAASTFVMNHRDWFRGKPPAPPKWETERVEIFNGQFPESSKSDARARQILMSLGMDGAHSAAERDGKIVIQRMGAVYPQRLTFDPADRRVTIERQTLDGPSFLERMHRRRGYQHPYLLDDGWAASVDLFIVAVLFWALSGLWLWWEMKATRRLGAMAAAAGLALFGFFLVLL